MMKGQNNLIEDLLNRGHNKIDEASQHLKKRHYSESISASQECIELSIKAMFVLLEKDYPKKHRFKEKEFKEVLDKIPEGDCLLNCVSSFPSLYPILKEDGKLAVDRSPVPDRPAPLPLKLKGRHIQTF